MGQKYALGLRYGAGTTPDSLWDRDRGWSLMHATLYDRTSDVRAIVEDIQNRANWYNPSYHTLEVLAVTFEVVETF